MTRIFFCLLRLAVWEVRVFIPISQCYVALNFILPFFSSAPHSPSFLSGFKTVLLAAILQEFSNWCTNFRNCFRFSPSSDFSFDS